MLGENIKLAFHSLAANKLRTFLTMLGIMIGIASVVAIYTLGSSQTKTYEEQMASNGINNITLFLDTEDWTNHFDEVTMTEDLWNKFLARYDGQIASVATVNYGGGGTVYADENKMEENYNAVTMEGVTRGYFITQNVNLTTGRTFSAAEMNSGASVCVLSDYSVKYLFDGNATDAIGSTVHIKMSNDSVYDMRVIGVFSYDMSNAGRSGSSKPQDRTTDFLVPYSYVSNLAAATEDEQSAAYAAHVEVLYIQAAVGVDVIELSDDMQEWVKAQFPEESKPQIEAYNNKEGIEQARKSMQAQVRTTAMIAAIALLVGGIGVMNIMTVTITERTREIGTRKALGAKSKAIRQQFIIEAAVMSVVGGAIGMIAGFIGGVVGCNMMNYTLAIPWEAILGSFAISLFVGVFFGYYPADKAAKMNPIDALRYE